MDAVIDGGHGSQTCLILAGALAGAAGTLAGGLGLAGAAGTLPRGLMGKVLLAKVEIAC